MKVIFVGDIHGQVGKLPREAELPIVQVGDLGAGFMADSEMERLAQRTNFFFIRGNHDDPAKCARQPGYLGGYGGTGRKGFEGLFFLSGGFSVDAARRVAGRDWWPDEELSHEHLREAISIYGDMLPDVMVSHEAPVSVAFEVLDMLPMLGKPLYDFGPSRTSLALEAMLMTHRPKLWIFGHYHVSFYREIGGTLFVGLGIGEAWPVELDDYKTEEA